MSASALTVRWSLAEAPEGVEQALRDYVAETSHARFEQREGLRFKTWRMRSGEWFEGCYESLGARIIGSAPVHIEECEAVAIAQGPEGFVSAASYDG